MKTTLSSLCLAVAATVMATTAANANIQQICKNYALTAVKQQQYNEKNKCGQKGDIWSTDLKAHIKFCATNPPPKWQAAEKMRVDAVKNCGG